MNIKLILTDIDGVWTDGGMHYTNHGDEIKSFNTSDSVGILLARTAEIPVMIATGEDVPSVRDRAKKLKIKNAHFGVKNKLDLLNKVTREMNITLKEVAFIGDEINDYPLLKKVGFSACPRTAPFYTKEVVDFIVDTDGGKGAFRDFVIEVLRRMGNFESTFKKVVGE